MREEEETYDIYLTDDAENDIFEAIDWYNDQLLGLGDEFELELMTALNKMKNHPFKYRVRYSNIRYLQLERFPYIIYYEIFQKVLLIYGILHGSRNPGIGPGRISNL